MAKRKRRKAETYRDARRNAVLRPAEGKPGVWEGAPARYVPYQAKPPVAKMTVMGFPFSRMRKQPKTYKYTGGGARERARRLRQMGAPEALAA